MVALGQFGRQGCSLKEVARATGYPLRTVQRAVRRLLETDEVFEPDRGRYVLKSVYLDLTADPTARVGFQNLRFRVTNWRETPPPPCRTARPWRTVPGGDDRPREICELAWRGRQVKLVYYPGPKVLDVIVAARDPIPLDAAAVFGEWLFAMLGLEQGETTEVTFIEVNSDHRLLRLEPLYVELRDLTNVARVLYQRSEALRQELRIATPKADEKPIGIREAILALTEGSPQARMERLLKLELEAASKVAQAAPPRTAPKRPDEARDAGYG